MTRFCNYCKTPHELTTAFWDFRGRAGIICRNYNRDYQKAYRERHKEKHTAYYREWQRANKIKRANQKETWRTNKRKTDPLFRLALSLRSRLAQALKGHKKAATTFALVGCSREELRTHLAAQFQPGMSWENYGEWHLDHIQPLSSFDLSDADQQRAANHFTNLQPLWAVDNLRKGAA